jgi:Tol biopolymer transport system component
MPPRYLHHAACLFLASTASAQSIELVSVSTNGTQGDDNSSGIFNTHCVSANGRFVLFFTRSHNFWLNDPDLPTGPDTDVFLRDRLLGTTTDVSEAFPNAISESISDDGEWVTFLSGGTTTWGQGISRSMIWERATGNVQPVSTGDLDSYSSVTSADGRYVAFAGRYLPNGVFNAPTQAWLLDRRTGSTVLASRTPAGAPGNQQVSGVSISADGLRVAFTSDASDLVPNDTNNASDVFVYDTLAQTVRRVSVDAQGVEGNYGSLWDSISADGRFVAFMSIATNFVPGFTSASQQLYRCEISTGAIDLLTVSSSGNHVSGQCGAVRLSGDGRLAFFSSGATTLVPNDVNQADDVFVRDTLNQTTVRISTALGGGEENGASELFSVSPDGRFVVFRSDANNLVPNDVNGVEDVFLLDRGPQCWISNYCTALPNSTGNAASISAQGVPSLSANNLVLACSGLPAATIGLFFAGTHAIDQSTPFGNGLRCVGGSLVQIGVVRANGSTATQVQDLSSPAYALVHAGDTRYFQFEYRNLAAGGAGFNTSDALLITFCP